MKTQPLRQHRNCLNCGKHVADRYCSHCGQENVAPHETFGHLIKHFVSDIFHYDSRFLLTLKYLFTRPGFLSREHRLGKRVSYVNPINLYLFTSFILFFIYMTWLKQITGLQEHHTQENGKTEVITLGPFKELTLMKRKVMPGVAQNDSASIRNYALLEQIETVTTQEEFDAINHQLPDSLHFTGLTKLLIQTDAAALKHYHSQEERERVYEEGYYHNFPKIMFFCLPFFALFLKVAFYRNKQWLYADHAIFTLHIHAFVFIVLAITLPLFWTLGRYLDNSLFHWILAGCFTLYLIIALRRNYGQPIWKSCVKGIALYGAYIGFVGLALTLTGILINVYHTYF